MFKICLRGISELRLYVTRNMGSHSDKVDASWSPSINWQKSNEMFRFQSILRITKPIDILQIPLYSAPVTRIYQGVNLEPDCSF